MQPRYIEVEPGLFAREAGRLFREPVVVSRVTVSPAYCGAISNRYGQMIDHYSIAYYMMVADRARLQVALRRASDGLLEEVYEKYQELHRNIESHTNMCSTHDCENTRKRWVIETDEKALKRLGVPYVLVHASLCGENIKPEEFEEKVAEMMYDIEEAVEEELCRRNKCPEY